DDPVWSHFWSAKFLALGRAGVWTYSHPIRPRTRCTRLYRGVTIHPPSGAAHPAGTRLFLGDGSELPEGTELRGRVADDRTRVLVRITVDILRLALGGEYDVILVLSQDQDLSEAASEARAVARERGRRVRLASAFPCGARGGPCRGI